LRGGEQPVRVPRVSFDEVKAVARLGRGAVSRAPREIERATVRPLLDTLSSAGRASPRRARKRYAALAEAYDRSTSRGAPYRRETVLKLAPAPGEVILDVGCGTGLNFALIEERIGPAGRLIGVDLSPAMLARARERVERHGWENVTLIESAAEEATLPVPVDAVMFCGTHDIMRSPAALEHVLRSLRPGGRVVAGGPKWVPWWLPGSVPLNLYTWQLNRDYVTTFEGFQRPWSHLARLVPDLQVAEVFLGGGYIAWGTRPAGAVE
jgi:ubiquinone/menaquinone biosynthesis C-methylase UbiE